jgi:LIM-domain binding protein
LRRVLGVHTHQYCTAEIGTPALPRFFLVTSQSGVKSMTLSLDGARERIVAPNCARVQCVSATWTYRYHNGYTVALRGPFTAYVVVIPNAIQSGASPESARNPTFSLKIGRIQFASNLYEKNVSVNAIGGSRLDANESPEVRNALTPPPTVSDADVPPFLQEVQEGKWEEPWITYDRAFIPMEPVNSFGVPQASMRCLEACLQNLCFACTNLNNPRGFLVRGEHRGHE